MFVVYVASARAGFQFAFVAEQVTTVWAPTGIAIASLLLWGARLWPAIWLGAFVVNAATAAPLWSAPMLASGNTLEAVAAVVLLRRFSTFDVRFWRVGDVVAYIGIAVAGCTILSATIGSATLCAAGVQPWSRFGAIWIDWWLGDALGALIVAPPILSIATASRFTGKDVLRFALFIGLSATVTHLVFGGFMDLGAHPLEYVVFPLMVGAAVAGGPPLTSSVVLASSAVTIWHTVHGAGPFAGSEIHHNLILLQTFSGVLATTALLLSAAIAERRTTELRHREAADTLRRREEMLRLAQRAGGVATFEWDFRNQVANCSPEFFALFGLPDRSGEMQGAEWAQFVHRDDRQRMSAHLGRALIGAEPAAADYRIVRADGTERWLSYAGHIEQLPDGARMLGTVLDITDRKRTEAALQDAKDAAESANRVKDQFLATLSHELRTPLNAILGYARMLQTNAIAPEHRQRAIEVIERNAAAQTQLIEDLLDVSRITRGEVRLEARPVKVATVLGEAIEVARPAAEAKRIAIDVDIDAARHTVNADPGRLRQVFWNILTNAVKFTETGGRVTVTLKRVGGEIEVVISDTGMGIASDFLPFVFEPFRQADARLARGHGGLGLGLAISRQLIELHGGTVNASSAGLGAGAAFVICLPALDGDAGTSHDPA